MPNPQKKSYVLLVEPDIQLASQYRQALVNDGLSVQSSENADGALAKIEKARPQCLVLEPLLPGHNGIELIHEVRSYPEWDRMPIILVTFVPEAELGLSESAKRQLFIADYIYKPELNLSMFVDRIRSIMETAP